MSPIRARSFLALLLALATAAVARGSDQTGAAAFEPYVKPKRVTRPRDLTKEFVQKEPGFALEYGGKRVSPAVPGFLYHGERIEGDRLLLENRHRGIQGWVPVSAVIPVAEAEAFFTQETVRYPRDSFAFLMRALVRLEKDDREHALADLNEALRREPKNVTALITRAFLLRISQQAKQALAEADQAVAFDPRNSYVLEQRAMIYGSLKKDDEALQDFERAIELGSRWVMTCVGRGMIYLKRGELERAQVEMQRALQIDPNCVQAFIYLAAIHLKLKDPDRALAAANKAIQIDPEYGEAYNARAVINRSIGHVIQAMKDLDQAVRIDPADANAVLNRAFFKVELNDYRTALADVDTAIRIDPNHAESHHGRAWILATCPDARYRKGERAVASAARACELANFKNPRFVSTLALAYSETGDFVAAVKWQESAIALLAANDPERREYSRLLNRYKSGKPYRRIGLLESLGRRPATVAAKAGAGNQE
jgi:tetratricopeptide (TPR) repeat protein